MKSKEPLRGEIWIADFEPVKGHEQGEKRPALIVSANGFNTSPADLVIVVPITSKDKKIRSHIPVKPPEGGLTKPSFIISEQPRTISKERLNKRLGAISPESLELVEEFLRVILEL